MKRLPLLAPVLVTLAAPLQAGEEREAGNCRASFEPGKPAAGEIPARKWFRGSYALTGLLLAGSLAYAMQNENYDGEGYVLISAFYVSLGASIALPLTVKPRPECSPPDNPAVDRDCNDAGYNRKLKCRSTLASLGGYAAAFLLFGCVVLPAFSP